jgi:hypothetical protein
MIRKCLLALGLTLLACAPVAAQQWASRMFESTEHDFGTVARGAKSEYQFVLSNIYLEDVHILSAHSSCGCTSVRILTPSLKTYERGAILATFNTGSFLGQRAATLTVVLDKPFYAEVQLHIRGNIRSDVVIEPGSVQIGDVEQGATAARKVVVSYAGRSDWKIVDVRGTNTHLSVDMLEGPRTYEGQVSYELTVHVDNSMPAGYVNDHLMLVTNDTEGTQIPLLVEGRILPGITVSPSSLFMGVVPPGQKVTKQLVVKSKRPFRIVSITCDDKSFQFGNISDPTPKTLHLVPVSFIAGGNAGKVNRTIKIETDLGTTAPELAAYAVVAEPQPGAAEK